MKHFLLNHSFFEKIEGQWHGNAFTEKTHNKFLL